MAITEGCRLRRAGPASAPAPWQGGCPQSIEDFSRLVDAFKDRMVRHAFRKLGDLHLAEDVAQEVFVRTFMARDRLANVMNVSAYLYRVASNLCTDSMRRRRKPDEDTDDAILAAAAAKNPSGREAAIASEELARVEAILRRIPEEQAEVIRLHVLDELAFTDIAAVTNSALSTVKSRFRYGLEKAREMMGKGQEVQQ